ncbi:MAG: helix-turn-helix domain-containing protein [Candidatus Aenigmarchaeota archaeon]|nr:helix-turn-helix domain-containing protein [Candidatus Aenigmarchaeota archaeon]
MLREKVGGILEKAEYEYSEYSGCFDIVARKEEILLLKVLENVDSFQEEQAENLKTLSANLEGSPALVGLCTRREKLQDNIIYERFEIPAFTPRTLENILVHNVHPVMYRFRGGFFAEINPQELRREREEKELTQSELAAKVGVTKKSIYEHEQKRMMARYDIARKMEKLLGPVINGIDFTSFSFNAPERHAKTSFERDISSELKRKGFGTDFIYQTPFNIIAKIYGKERFLVFSDAEENVRRIEKNEEHMLAFAEITEKPVIVVTRKRMELEVPVIPTEELREMTRRDIVRAAKKG